MRACSYCGKENPDEATSCSGCRTQLAPAPKAGGNLPPKLEDVQEREAGERLRTTGAAWLLGGIAFTLTSYLAAVHSPYGGHYFVAIGAICYGAMRFLKKYPGTPSSDEAQRNIRVLTAGQASGSSR